MDTLTLIGIIAGAIIAQVVILRAALNIEARTKHIKAQTNLLRMMALKLGVDKKEVGNMIVEVFYTKGQQWAYWDQQRKQEAAQQVNEGADK